MGATAVASSNDVKSVMVGKNMAPVGVAPSIVLEDPKYARNVSQIVRLASGYDINQVFFTGNRVSLTDPTKNLDGRSGSRTKKGAGKARLPREERMKGYQKVDICHHDRPFDCFSSGIPVIGIELREGALPLHQFEHPEEAIYVFGPEDGSINRLSRQVHQFVVIPVAHCLNLATAVSTILWDRKRQLIERGLLPDLTMDELLVGDRASLRMQDFESDDMLFDGGGKR
tara:strand:+ start:66644 stop:67327 length:684 start_codon:yes stop_codon:yes gene_type:complete